MRKEKRLLCTVLAFTLLLSLIPCAYAASHPFTDVKSGSWYADSVEFVYVNGLMNGTGSRTFEPEAKMSRAMLVTVLHRASGEPASTSAHPFTDVKSGNWYTAAVKWAYANRIVNGTSATKFSPNADITREQMVMIFYRYAKAEGYVITNYAKLSNYKDSGKISDFAREAFQWAVADGIIQGTSSTTLSPAGVATRAQCATIIQRFVKWTESNTGAENPTEPTTTPEPTPPATTEPTAPTGPATTEPPVHTHSFGSWSKVDSTCKAAGYYFRTCACGHTERGESIAKKEHSYAKVSSVAATCTNKGSETYTCSGCGDTYSVETDMIAHNWEQEHTDEVGGHWSDILLVCTCGWSCRESEANTAGYDVGYYWSFYHQDYYGANKGYNDHSYDMKGLVWVPDTPAGDKWTCSGCGTSTTNHDEVSGHTMYKRREAIGSHCTSGNHDEYACDSCSYAYETNYIESTGHIWGAWEITEEVTAESRGWAIRTCTKCGYEMGDYADLIDQHYHSYKPEMETVCILCHEDSVPAN